MTSLDFPPPMSSYQTQIFKMAPTSANYEVQRPGLLKKFRQLYQHGYSNCTRGVVTSLKRIDSLASRGRLVVCYFSQALSSSKYPGNDWEEILLTLLPGDIYNCCVWVCPLNLIIVRVDLQEHHYAPTVFRLYCDNMDPESRDVSSLAISSDLADLYSISRLQWLTNTFLHLLHQVRWTKEYRNSCVFV